MVSEWWLVHSTEWWIHRWRYNSVLQANTQQGDFPGPGTDHRWLTYYGMSQGNLVPRASSEIIPFSKTVTSESSLMLLFLYRVNPKWPLIFAFSSFFGAVWTENIDAFSEWNKGRFQISPAYYRRRPNLFCCVRYHQCCQLLEINGIKALHYNPFFGIFFFTKKFFRRGDWVPYCEKCCLAVIFYVYFCFLAPVSNQKSRNKVRIYNP